VGYERFLLGNGTGLIKKEKIYILLFPSSKNKC
jgi:hypothetical protein